jgi:hypothetical protein
MAQKYRHIIPWNPQQLACNHNLFDIHPLNLTEYEQKALMTVLNSTVVGLFKHFYGRYAGSEGTLKTEVVDVLMLEVPSPVGVPKELCERLGRALDAVSSRGVTHLVEQEFLDCHTEPTMRELQAATLGLPLELRRQDRHELDLLVFELLGVAESKRRQEFVDRLYYETTRYYREQRIQDIQSTINRSKTKGGGNVSQMELAVDGWNHLDPEFQKPLSAWLADKTERAKTVELPEGEVRLARAENWFEATTVYFGKKPAVSHVCASRPEAELLAAIAREGLRGPVSVPTTEERCRTVYQSLENRLSSGRAKFEELAKERAGSDKLREQVTELLYRWFIHGRPT